jgi:tetratricopeptide (TPR) repeat protein
VRDEPGDLAQLLGNFDQAMIEWERAADALHKTGLAIYEADAANYIAESHFETESYEEAINWYTRAKRAYEASGYNGNAMCCDSRIAEAKEQMKVSRSKTG